MSGSQIPPSMGLGLVCLGWALLWKYMSAGLSGRQLMYVDDRGAGYSFARYVMGHPNPATVLSEEEQAELTSLNGVYWGKLWSPRETKDAMSYTAVLFSMYGTLLSLALVFRIKMSYNRYLAGVNGVKMAYTKYADSCMQLVAFANVSRLKHHNNAEVLMRLENYKCIMVHWFTLLSAQSITELKYSFSEEGESPQVCAREILKDNLSRVVRNTTQGKMILGRKGVVRAVHLRTKLLFHLFLDSRRNYNYYHSNNLLGFGCTKTCTRRVPFAEAVIIYVPRYCVQFSLVIRLQCH